VEFKETNECKAVPIDWVVVKDNGDAKCFYPPSSTAYKEMLSLLKKSQFPQPGWQEYVCRVFGRSKTGSCYKYYHKLLLIIKKFQNLTSNLIS
jgi:hypothetical protein